jgi:hypothetical protein
MSQKLVEETFVDQTVTYTLEIEGRFVIIEHVPARVSARTGERFFSPETVARLQRVVWDGKTPSRVVEAPVFEYTSIRT